MTTIDEHAYNDKLEDALQILAAGTPVDEILAHANSDAEWLAPLLETAAEVTDLQQSIPIPPPDASLQRLLAYGEELATASQPVASQPPSPRQNLFGGWWPRFSMGMAAVLLLILIFLGGLNSAAQDSLPGQPLFSIKMAGETLQLNLPWNFERREQLLEHFNKRRQNEVTLLLEQGLQVNVAFSGWVESLADQTLVVDGFTIDITPETDTTGEPATGARIRVTGLTQPPGKLIALTIIVTEPGLPVLVTPTPLPSDTPSPTSTHTSTRVFSPTPIETLLPTLTPTLIVVENPTATDTPTSSPTPSYTPLPTATVEPDTKDDNDINDNTDGGFIDNDDSSDIDDTEDFSNDEDEFDNDDDLGDDNIDDDFDDEDAPNENSDFNDDDDVDVDVDVDDDNDNSDNEDEEDGDNSNDEGDEENDNS